MIHNNNVNPNPSSHQMLILANSNELTSPPLTHCQNNNNNNNNSNADWYLTVRDNEWCDPIGRTTNGGSSSPSDRLQQLASDQAAAAAYATRVSMPANHKPAQVSAAPTQQQQLFAQEVTMGGQLETALASAVAPLSPTSGNGLDTNNIIVSATPLTAHDIYKAS